VNAHAKAAILVNLIILCWAQAPKPGGDSVRPCLPDFGSHCGGPRVLSHADPDFWCLNCVVRARDAVQDGLDRYLFCGAFVKNLL